MNEIRDIRDDPALQRLANQYAQRIGRIVFWVGAGLSKAGNYPDWMELRDKLVHAARRKSATLDKAGGEQGRLKIASALQKDNLWEAFDILFDVLQVASFNEEVRSVFSKPPPDKAYEIYNRIWKLNISGLVSLNIDKIALNSYLRINKTMPNHIVGNNCGSRIRMLKESSKYLINLHGVIDDHQTWILRQKQINDLQGKEDYQQLISVLFGSATIVFVGLTAEDRAAGGLLENFTRKKIDFGPHYWITSRRDAETDMWAEKAGIQVIRYQASDKLEHSKKINEILQVLERYKVSEFTAPPVITDMGYSPGDIIDPTDLAQYDPETIRHELNREAAHVLDGSDGQYERFAQFCALYSRPIHNSWHVSTRDPDNIIFGYRIIEAVGSGAFGTVYRAESEDGMVVAIKLLRQEVRTDDRMLGSFRRGVESMRLLAKHKVQGMVPYYKAFELPTCVIMEFIEGSTVEEIIDRSEVSILGDVLLIAAKVANIVYSAHLLPEHILHRDLRPSNVMVRGFGLHEIEKFDVVVLDFDMSWHKNAIEKSISVHASTALGYLAPEQLTTVPNSTSRSSAVDSYGLAMFLFFMLGRRHPVAGEALSAEWERSVLRAAKTPSGSHWKAVPRRLARAIVQATKLNQASRPRFSDLLSEIESLALVVRSNERHIEFGVDFWIEELFNASYQDRHYKRDDLNGSIIAEFASGVSVKLMHAELANVIRITIEWTAGGQQKYKNVEKYLPAAMSRIVDHLQKSGWSIKSNRNNSRMNVHIEGTINLQTIVDRFDENIKFVSGIAGEFDFN